MVILIKPEVVNHCDNKKYRCAIYSVDFQPFGNRIATAGGGNLFWWDYILTWFCMCIHMHTILRLYMQGVGLKCFV